MKIKVSCKTHGDSMDTTGTPFFVATDHTRTTFELDLSDMWCSESRFNEATNEYEQCELKVEVL